MGWLGWLSLLGWLLGVVRVVEPDGVVGVVRENCGTKFFSIPLPDLAAVRLVKSWAKLSNIG